ncbi:MAG: heme lyase CcmF/NrfE family subunit [Paracoccaceae bacterium]|nr:heme lyase CcmF/NrfE family subunit [Paracoccaceae bacterium]
MLIEIAHVSLILTLMLSLIQFSIPLIGAKHGWINWMKLSDTTAFLQFVLTCFGFFILMRAFIISDFTVKLVALNSHTMKPLIYKITGTWGNHEGSMLLWILILNFYGFLITIFGTRLPAELKCRVLSVQGLISAAFLGFLLFTSNPFARELAPPIDGNGLNPVLQDLGLAFHPPFLYLGYVGLSVTFSFAVAALLQGKIDSSWARWVRPWALSAWMFLTVGIALGSYWAYYELGWGGWWFWDPVENASFMPWLASTALLHSAAVVEKRNTLKSWTILLSILAFSFSLVGTFIVRSGVLTSVHAFASDPSRGVYLLIIVFLFILFALSLYAARFSSIKSVNQFAFFSRESGLVLNNLLLSVAALIVFIGTLWPLIVETLFNEKISVGAPFFELAFTPFIILLALLLPIGIILPWKRGKVANLKSNLLTVAILSVISGSAVWSFQTGGRILAPIGASLSVWIVLGSLFDIVKRIKLFEVTLLNSLKRLTKLPRGDLGRFVAHMGFGLMIFGVSAVSAWEIEDIRVAKLNEPYQVEDYTIQLTQVSEFAKFNYITRQGVILVKIGDDIITTLFPEKRFYPIQITSTTEASIHSNIFRDIYVVLGDNKSQDFWVVRTYIKPFILWIWLGASMIALGGIISLTDRRYRLAMFM